MTSHLKHIDAITLFIADISRSKCFYADALGWSVQWEDTQSVGFDAGNTIVNLLLESEATNLIAPVAVGSAGVGQRVMFSIFVENTDAVLEQLAERGITPVNGPIDRPWGMRTACVVDPDGYVWEVAQRIG